MTLMEDLRDFGVYCRTAELWEVVVLTCLMVPILAFNFTMQWLGQNYDRRERSR